MAWESFGTDGTGQRVSEMVANGVRAPSMNDRLLLFLGPEDPGRRAAFDGIPTHYPVSLEGVAFLDEDVVTETADDGLLEPYIGTPVGDIAALPMD